MIAVQQLRKSLELVEDDQVRLERVDADVREATPQSGYRLVAGLGHLLRILASPPVEELAEFAQNVEEIPVRASNLKVCDQLLINVVERCLFDGPPPAIVAGSHLKQVVEAACWLDPMLEEVEQKRPLLADTGGRPQIERRSRCEADEVDLVAPKSMVACQLQGQERHSRGQLEFLLAEYIEPVDVLAGDRLVRADVEHVDAFHAVPEPFDCTRDYASRNHGLPETDLVGDQEAHRGIRILVEAAHYIVDGPTLKLLERSQRRFRVEPFDVRHGSDLPHPESRGTHPTTW